MIIEKQKYLKYILFAVIAFSVIIIVLSRESDDKEIVDNLSLVEEVRMNIKDYLDLTDSLSLLSDLDFCVQYRVKPDEYYFYQLIDDRLGAAICLPESFKNNVVSIFKKTSITSVWKYRNENFYRYELRKSYEYKPQLIVLKKAGDSFAFFEGTSISKADTTSDVNKINGDSKQDLIFKLSDRIWVYF
jgi:hypothetical protein